jgi:hypothetical protein
MPLSGPGIDLVEILRLLRVLLPAILPIKISSWPSLGGSCTSSGPGLSPGAASSSRKCMSGLTALTKRRL